MSVKTKRTGFAAFVALIVCFALVASGCSTTDEADPAVGAAMNDIGESAAESTEDTVPAAGVYAELIRHDQKIEITPIEGGITDSTVLPTFKCTFGNMTSEAQNALSTLAAMANEFWSLDPALQNVEYSGSIDSTETIAVWWTIFDVADGNIQ